MASPDNLLCLPKSINDDTTYFSFGCRIFVTASCFQLASVGEITSYFVPSQRIENRWTSDGKQQFFRWF